MSINPLTLPDHTTHKLKPLDSSVFGPFKNYFRVDPTSSMAKNPRVEVKRFELVELASKEFKSALTPSNIKDGFRRTIIVTKPGHKKIENIDECLRNNSPRGDNLLYITQMNNSWMLQITRAPFYI